MSTITHLTQHARHGQAPEAPRRKIPTSEYPTILRRLAAGETLKAVARDYDVRHGTIGRVATLYGHFEYPELAAASRKPGERRGRPPKIARSEYPKIAARLAAGERPTAVARDYGVSRGTIDNIALHVQVAQATAGRAA